MEKIYGECDFDFIISYTDIKNYTNNFYRMCIENILREFDRTIKYAIKCN